MFEKFDDLAEDTPPHVPTFGLRIYAYYGQDGLLAYKMDLDEDQGAPTPITTLLGVLELARAEITHAALKAGKPGLYS